MDGIGFMQPLKPKLPAALQLSANLAAYISSAYNQDPKSYINELKELESMRESAVNAPVSPNSVDLINRYIKECSVLPSRFPVDEDNIKLAISWYNSFQADKGVKPLAFFSLGYEQAATMFNLGVLFARLGNSEVISGGGNTVEALKRACGYYMQAAGVFHEILAVTKDLALPPSCDLCNQVLNGLVDLMLGQAQECVYWKGVVDGSKVGVLAKVALGAHEFYSKAVSSFGDVPVLTGSSDGRALLITTQNKAILFQIFAEHRKAIESRQTMKFGEEMGRLQYIYDNLIPKLNHEKGPSEFNVRVKDICSYITTDYNRAKKDNTLIYHETPVPRSQQPSITSVAMVKPTAYTLPSGNSIFESLIPLRLHQAMTRYQRAKMERIGQIINSLEKEKSSVLEVLKKNNLPGALEAIEQPIGFPESLVSKMHDLQNQGGMSSLRASIGLIQQLSIDAQRLLGEAEKILNDELNEDERYKNSFKGEWRRTRSRQAASSYYEKLDQVRTALHTAADADAVIRSRLERYGKDLDILCGGSVEAVALLIPAAHSSNRLSPAARIAVERVKNWTGNVNNLIRDINNAIADINSFSENDYPVGPMSNATNEEKTVRVITSELDKYKKYAEFGKSFNETSVQIKSISEAVIREFNNAIVNCGANSSERQAVLQRLDDAYRHYLLINKDLADGINFYTSLLEPLNRLKSDIADYATSRAVEAEELAVELQRSMSPVRSMTETAFPAASAPSDPWTASSVGHGGYPSAYGSAAGSKHKWTPGMPINYAKK